MSFSTCFVTFVYYTVFIVFLWLRFYWQHIGSTGSCLQILWLAVCASVMSGSKHTMPKSDEEVQKQVEAVFGFRPCLWQIRVVRAILNGDDVITIAPTGSGKSMTYWMPLLYIKHGIIVVVTPLKLLGGQFVDMLQGNGISAVSITASNATNELFEVTIY